MSEGEKLGYSHKIDGAEFVRRLRAKVDQPDCPIAFFLGAGCSVSSGIPASRSLVRDIWLPRLRKILGGPPGQGVDEWAMEEVQGYDPENPAASYGRVMEMLFHEDEWRQREIERLCQGRMPTFGYGVLATLMAEKPESFSVVLTTNFDDLVADAMYLFTGRRPLVIHHESLAGYIRSHRTRPMLVKLHGDNQLSPQNIDEEVGRIRGDVEERVAGLLSERGLVFLGYGGADKDIVDMLERLPESALPHGIYWVAENWPATAVGDWLADRRDVTWVTSGDFDELMLLVRHEFALPHPKIDPIQAVFDGYSKTFADLSQKVLGLSPDEPSSVPLREARERAVAEMDDWWAFEIRAREFKDTNPDRTDQIYREGLEAFPESKELLNNYASFLTGIRGEHDRAEEFYRRAMEVDPNQATILSNYAKLLTNVRGDHDGAEEHYRRALEADPNYVTALGNYAIFLETVRGDHDGAEEHYKRALELDPNHANALGGYALFLRSVRGDNAGAEEYFLRAIEADPDHANNLGNYAGFLLGLGRLEEGLDLLTRAMSNSEFPTNFELQAECWFYLYANGPADRRDEALIELKRVLADGGRSAGWDLSANIVRAIKDDHPAGDWIAKLAAVIADEAEMQSLDDWDDWAKA